VNTAGAAELSPADLEEFPHPDPNRGFLVLATGKKESGKSQIGGAIFDRYPYDGLCIDPTGGDAVLGPDVEPIYEPLPTVFPRPWHQDPDDGPLKLVYRPDPKSPTFRDDQDHAIGMVLYPRDRPCMLYHDDASLLTRGAHDAGDNTRLLMISMRHYGPVSAAMMFQRPLTIDPLWLHQADLVYIFTVPNRRDRKHLAENMGYPPERFEREYTETVRRGPYWFLLYDNTKPHGVLWRCPPLPDWARVTAGGNSQHPLTS
jgi:hypothetical protein